MNNPVLHGISAISETVLFGNYCTVWQFTTICEHTVIGHGSVIGSGVWIGKNCRIGNNVHIQHGAFIPNGTVLEDNVFIGPLVVLTDDKYPRSGNDDYIPNPPRICQGASIGAGAVILPGVVVEAGAMIGAGAVVTHSVGYGDLSLGNPARSQYHEVRP